MTMQNFGYTEEKFQTRLIENTKKNIAHTRIEIIEIRIFEIIKNLNRIKHDWQRMQVKKLTAKITSLENRIYEEKTKNHTSLNRDNVRKSLIHFFCMTKVYFGKFPSKYQVCDHYLFLKAIIFCKSMKKLP